MNWYIYTSNFSVLGPFVDKSKANDISDRINGLVFSEAKILGISNEVPSFNTICLGLEKLSLGNLRLVEQKAVQLQRAAELKLQKAKENALPEDLLPDWCCYDNTPKDVIEQLDSKAVLLIKAIRSGDTEKIDAAMRLFRKIQHQWAKYGTDDTEGREVLWTLVQDACIGTIIDPKKLWNKYY